MTEKKMMLGKARAFTDRGALSESDDETTPDPGTSTESFLPVPDTGLKTGITERATTRAAKRAQDPIGAPSCVPAKKQKHRSDESSRITARLDRQEAVLQDILKELRNLSSTIDDLKTTVTNKMTLMETKLGVQQDRIESLQTARRDGFLHAMTLDTAQQEPLPEVPHFVNQPLTTARTPAPKPAEGNSMLAMFGL